MLNIFNQIREVIFRAGIIIMVALHYLVNSWNGFKICILILVFVSSILSISSQPERRSHE
jgi:disulfide bond formation protein DsbB